MRGWCRVALCCSHACCTILPVLFQSGVGRDVACEVSVQWCSGVSMYGVSAFRVGWVSSPCTLVPLYLDGSSRGSFCTVLEHGGMGTVKPCPQEDASGHARRTGNWTHPVPYGLCCLRSRRSDCECRCAERALAAARTRARCRCIVWGQLGSTMRFQAREMVSAGRSGSGWPRDRRQDCLQPSHRAKSF